MALVLVVVLVVVAVVLVIHPIAFFRENSTEKPSCRPASSRHVGPVGCGRTRTSSPATPSGRRRR